MSNKFQNLRNKFKKRDNVTTLPPPPPKPVAGQAFSNVANLLRTGIFAGGHAHIVAEAIRWMEDCAKQANEQAEGKDGVPEGTA